MIIPHTYKKMILVFLTIGGIFLFSREIFSLNHVYLQASPKAITYYYYSNMIWIIKLMVSICFFGIILFTGFSAKIWQFAQKICNKNWLAILFYGLIFTIISSITIPLDFIETYSIEQIFGLSNQSLQKWISDFLIGNFIMLILSSFGMLFLYWFLQKAVKRWWLYFGLFLSGASIILSIIAPIWIAPLFNQYQPLENGELKKSISHLTQRLGLQNIQIIKVNKSIDTNTGNAFVTGLFNTQQIVIFDTLLQKLNNNEIQFIIAHELAHYVLKHQLIQMLLNAIMIIGSFFIGNLIIEKIIHIYKQKFRFESIREVASFPLILLVMSLIMFIYSPLTNLINRHFEFEADRFAIELTHNNQVGISAFKKLYSSALLIPNPGLWYQILRLDHPSLERRIQFLESYQPFENGHVLKYSKYFISI